jgi:hypothetical protein
MYTPCRPTQTVRHTCSGNLRIVKILRYIRSDMYTTSATNSKQLYITQSPNLVISKKLNKIFHQMVMGVHQKNLRIKVVHGGKRLRTTALNFFTAPVSMLLHSSISVQIEQNAVKFKSAPRNYITMNPS